MSVIDAQQWERALDVKRPIHVWQQTGKGSLRTAQIPDWAKLQVNQELPWMRVFTAVIRHDVGGHAHLQVVISADEEAATNGS